jgi:hypothetical protein
MANDIGELANALRQKGQKLIDAADVLIDVNPDIYGRRKPMQTVTESVPRRSMSQTARRKIGRAQRARWKKLRQDQAA